MNKKVYPTPLDVCTVIKQKSTVVLPAQHFYTIFVSPNIPNVYTTPTLCLHYPLKYFSLVM